MRAKTTILLVLLTLAICFAAWPLLTHGIHPSAITNSIFRTYLVAGFLIFFFFEPLNIINRFDEPYKSKFQTYRTLGILAIVLAVTFAAIESYIAATIFIVGEMLLFNQGRRIWRSRHHPHTGPAGAMEAEMMATIDQEFDVKQKKALLSSLEKFRRDTFPQKNDHAVGEKTMPPEELRKHGGI